MLQLTRVYMGNSMFRGNASLNGQLSHVLEEQNVTQVLPLEPPDAWARRQNEVLAYLKMFRQLVQLFNMERPTKCECPGDRAGSRARGTSPALPGHGGSSAGTGEDGDMAMGKTSLWAEGTPPWSQEFHTRSTPWERGDSQLQEKGWRLQPEGGEV